MTTIMDSMGSGEGVSGCVCACGGGQLDRRSGRGWDGCAGDPRFPQESGGSAEAQGVTGGSAEAQEVTGQGNMAPLHQP